MHVSLLRRLFFLWGVVYALTHALSNPKNHVQDKTARGVSSYSSEPPTVLLEDRSPRGSRGGSRRPKATKPKPKSKAKLKSKSKSKAKSKTKAKSDPKSTLTGTANPKPSAVTFPRLKVPYIDTATDLCELYITCGDENTGAAEGLTVRRDTYYPWYQERDQGGLKILGYPENTKLYTATRAHNRKRVFRFRNDKVGSTIVDGFQTVVGSIGDYATEHILELQTVPLFHRWAEEQDPTLVKFFKKEEWEKTRLPSRIQSRPAKPPYYDDQVNSGVRPARLSLNQLVFDAFGSTINTGEFVLLENELNGYMARLWRTVSPMEDGKYDAAYGDAMSGARSSNVYLTAIRTVFGVYEYLNSDTVHRNLRIINTNIKLELSNARHVTGSGPTLPDLVSMWDSFLDQHFKKVDQKSQEWVKKSIEKAMNALEAAMKDKKGLFKQLSKAEETSQNAFAGRKKQGQAYIDQQRKKQIELTAKLTPQARVMRRRRKDLVALQRMDTKGWNKKAINVHNTKIAEAKESLIEALRNHGLTQRAIHELYSHSVQNIITNLTKEKNRLIAFRKKIDTALNMPRI